MATYQISSNSPTYLLADFEIFLHYFLSQKVKLTGAGFLPAKVCYELNEKMNEPQQEVNVRTRHQHYTKLYLFYQLCVSGQLFTLSPKGKSTYVLPNLDKSEEYLGLTKTEQYMSLLAILWIHSDWEPLHNPERPRSPAANIHLFLKKVAKLKEATTTLVKEEFRFITELYPFVKYFEFFGFWETSLEQYRESNHYYLSECTPSQLGIEMARILTTDRQIGVWNKLESRGDDFFYFSFGDNEEEYTEEEEEARIEQAKKESFLEAFIPLFPKGELKRTLTFAEPKFEKGNYIFTVRFKHIPKVWRKISMPADHTLEYLHLVIQEAIEFENDHLYAFYLDNNRYSRNVYYHTYSDIGPYADEIQIGALQINVGQPFLYLFDFGDSWEFEVVLEKIDTESDILEDPVIIESHGEAPDQYPDFDEEGDWGDF